MQPAIVNQSVQTPEPPPSPRREQHATFTHLMRQGYVILPRLLSGADLLAVRTELAPFLNVTPKCVGDFHGWQTTRVNALLTKAPSTQKLVLNKRILKLVSRVLKPACDRIQLNLTQAIRVHPSERAQAPHRDEDMWPLEPKAGPWLVNVMWALTEFSDENGATRLWPRSHLTKLERGAVKGESIAAQMPAGSALIFLGSLTHGAGPNTSTAPRDGLIVSYALGWLRQYENQFLAYPRDEVRAFPRALQRLIGYQTHRPNLGFWEGQDPIRALSANPPLYAPHIDALTPAIARELKVHYGESE